MNIDLPLPPHLQQFLREQLASGRFRTESDVMEAALRLLAEQSASRGVFGRNPDPAAVDTSGLKKPLASSHGSREPMIGAEFAHSGPRRSPRGILADLPSHIDADEIKEARDEMWAGLRHGRP